MSMVAKIFLDKKTTETTCIIINILVLGQLYIFTANMFYRLSKKKRIVWNFRNNGRRKWFQVTSAGL